MRIVIAGCGIVGTALAERMAINKHNVTVIDINEHHLNYVQNTLDVMCILGNAISPDIQNEAGVKNAHLFIAVTDSDEHNLLACLIARKLGAGNTIARVRTSQNEVAANLLKDEMGLSMVINPEMDVAREIFNSLKYKPVGNVETLAKGSTEIITIKVKSNAPICGLQLKDLYNVTGARILVCGIKRNEKVFMPTAGTVIEANDTLSYAATTKDSLLFLKKMKYDSEKTRNLTIIGGSKLGVFLARKVLDTGVPVKVIDNNETRCKQLLSLIPGADIICGDGTDSDLLDEEDVLESSVVVCATEDDSTNAMLALYISRVAPECKVIIKIKKSDFEDMLYNMNFGAVYNPKYVTVENISRYVSAMQESLVKDELESVSKVIDNKVSILEFNINADMPHLDVPLMELKFKKDVLIAIIYRNGQPFIPGGKDVINVGDIVIAATMNSDVDRFSKLFV